MKREDAERWLMEDEPASGVLVWHGEEEPADPLAVTSEPPARCPRCEAAVDFRRGPCPTCRISYVPPEEWQP